MAIASVEFDLSMVDPDTGLFNTARIYTVDGVNNVDGSPRELSIGQLVMAICLQRAAELEAAIIQKMEELENTSSNLEALTAIENEVLTWVEALLSEPVLPPGVLEAEVSPQPTRSMDSITAGIISFLEDEFMFISFR